MTSRRTVLVGFGGLAAAGTFLGTGAFSQVTAERQVTVETAGDASALLTLTPQSEFATSDNDGLLELDLSGTVGESQGLNRNGFTFLRSVFSITNRGTQTVEIQFAFDGEQIEETVSGAQDQSLSSDENFGIWPGTEADDNEGSIWVVFGSGEFIGFDPDDHELSPGEETMVSFNYEERGIVREIDYLSLITEATAVDD
ncbi:hypothetical protein [Natronorubrum sp. DTA7]|uniref:hypothetical protein n=1 Tax=Natronorubrum sp. DTA7 TaxID=3447016 RepID=UPI003F85B32D